MGLRRLAGAVVVAVAGALLAAPAPPAAPLDDCAQRVIRDWYSGGRVDGVYPLACYRAALEALPADVLQYSNADQDIRRALAYAKRGRTDPGVTPRPAPAPAHTTPPPAPVETPPTDTAPEPDTTPPPPPAPVAEAAAPAPAATAASSTGSGSGSDTGAIVLAVIALVLAAGALGVAVVTRAKVRG